MQIDKKKPAMVTGATGYVAGVLIKKLLEAGIDVHAAVRNPDRKDKLKHLDELAANATGNISYFKADLLVEGAYEEAMQGCEVVFHTASPFILKYDDPQKDLVDPAVKGTRNVLESVNRVPSVKRVVLTSSCAAIYGDNIDLQQTANGVFTEKDWNTTSTLHHQSYSYSKVMAEKTAWEVAKAQDRWDLVVVNPSLVIGPGINPDATSASFDIARQIGDGTLKLGAPGYNIGCVDVQDVADVHFQAAYTPTAKGRYVCSGEDSSFLELASHLVPDYGDKYPLPTRKLPKWLVWLIAPATGMTRKSVSNNIDHPWHADHSKAEKELGIQFRPIAPAMKGMFQQLIDSGQL
jgi:dihydroflavonol-4-reductase